jgi:2-haloacid dehalogenase
MTPLKKSVMHYLTMGFRIWFGTLLHYSIVSNSINEYHDFGTIAGATLAMAATSMNRKVDEDEIKEALSLNITGIPRCGERFATVKG